MKQEIGILAPFLEGIEGMRIILKDLSRRYTYVSSAWSESTGLEDVLGKTVFDVFPLWRALKYHEEEQRVIERGEVIDTLEEITLVEGGRTQLWRSIKGPRMNNGKIIGMVILSMRIDSEMVQSRLRDHRPKAVERLERHATEHLTIQELADELELSKRTFEREIRRETGMSPADYRRKCRISHARDLLRYSQKNLADIASECGFHDQSHFSKVFCQEVGLSPGRWRREEHKN